MQEIGSEFWEVPVSTSNNNLFPSSTQWFLCGRSALQAIIKDLNDCHTVALPSWCCHTMIKPFVDAELEVRFYPVYFDRGLHQKLRFDCDVLLLIDYFGYSSFLNLPDLFDLYNLGDYKGIIIRDVTHSIFSAFYSDADYYFGSLRKWCGFWTGGFAWTRDGHELATKSVSSNSSIDASDAIITNRYISLRKKAMELKGCYIKEKKLNDYGNVITDKGYLKLFEQAENILDSNTTIISASGRDIDLARKLDVQFIRNRRRRNAKILMNAFPEWLIFKKSTDVTVPLCVSVLVPDGKRNQLRQYLIQHEIYCPVHWPVTVYHSGFDERTQNIYINELSLVCDQRYTEDDMNEMIRLINAFWKKV